MRKARTVLGVVLMAAVCLAQTRTAPKSAAAHKRQAAPTAAAAKPDREIEAAIRAKFAKSKIGADGFQVRVQGGVATIEGRTDVIQHKGVATRLAKSGGALAVNNRIQPSEAARARAAANLAKGRRRVQVKRGEARSETGAQRGRSR